jgi:hypothetical protein
MAACEETREQMEKELSEYYAKDKKEFLISKKLKNRAQNGSQYNKIFLDSGKELFEEFKNSEYSKKRKPKAIKNPKNKGTGAGGANTNANGLSFEDATEPQEFYEVLKKCKHHQEIRFHDCQKTYILTKRAGFSNYMGENMDKTIEALHGAKQPDETYIDEEEKVVFIIEKKFQQTSGSVNEKLQTYPNKIRNYQRRIPDYKIVYVYCLAEWFRTYCKAEIQYLKEDNIPFFWGTSETYKDDIVNFIVNFNNNE